jgi:hydrogenase maturation protease
MTSMQILVAGIGNIFFSDDAFGIEVVHRLSQRKLPEGVSVRDFGLRGFDLACSITEPWELVILVDATRKGGEPGSVYVIELDRKNPNKDFTSVIEPHGIDPVRAIELANTIGEIKAPLILVGCEPATIGGDEGFVGLSVPVKRGVGIAVEAIERVISKFQAGQNHKGKIGAVV